MTKKFRYLPFLNGVYSTAPGIKPTNKNAKKEDRQILQIDDHYMAYLYNKKKCREENIHKYYLEHELKPSTIKTVNAYLLKSMLYEYSNFFLKLDENQLLNKFNNELIELTNDGVSVKSNFYQSAFDALVSQLQEDVAVFQLGNDKDYLAAIHLCAPNHWSPADKIGRAFDVIHRPIPNMDATNQHYQKILDTIIKKRGPFTRFAWGIATDERLNHHPDPPTNTAHIDWHGRQPKEDESPIYVRVERQNLVGFPEINAFMFTIRTFFYNVETFTTEEKRQLWSAVQSMSVESLHYKGLADWKDRLKQKLNISALEHSSNLSG
ncbi:hypothetical protein TDB9533_00679 [Thalassocella blandensis]|nr:hypothetical protein TDB9533_00679 [Thalassocella blandensis]